MKIPELIAGHKSVFGTYAAMALNNIRIVLNHIQVLTDIPGHVLKDEDCWEHPVMLYLRDSDNLHKSPETVDNIKNRLLRSFPFLKIMAENQREYLNKKHGTTRMDINGQDMYWILNNTFRVLKKYRDYSLHYIMLDNCFDDSSKFLQYNETPLSYTINQYYTAALRMVKERYKYSTQDLAFIQDYRIDRKSKRTNFNFFLSMQSYNCDDTKQAHLSGVGVTQLICLFLEKKYINLFISTLPIFEKYRQESEERRVIRRSLSINSIVLPKERIQSQQKEFSIALDMLGELKRCPKELFETLAHDDQDEFRTLSTDFNEVLHMRSSDRFAQHSLQYIDHNKLFAGIRFHVNMGKLRYLFSPAKKCIDGEERVRVLEHKLNGFGRIAEMEQYRRGPENKFGDTNILIRGFADSRRDDSNEDNYPYVVDTYTHYILENNKIELCFSSENIVPQINHSGGKWNVLKEPPHCRMSLLELPAMMFHLHLLGAAKTEARILKVFQAYLNLFEALSTGQLTQDNIDSFGISRSDLPQKVLDAISGEDRTPKWRSFAKKMVEDMQMETEHRIKSFKTLKSTIRTGINKIGSRSYKSVSPGKLADYLAHDIVKFQPSRTTGDDYGVDRVTGLNFRVMQASIALYNCECDDTKCTELYNMFKAAHLIGNRSQAHPFLEKALMQRPKNTIELYEKYLYARKKYLDMVSDQIKNGEMPQLACFNRDRNKWIRRDNEYYKVMGAIYLEDTPIELPRQMFDEDIKAALKLKPQMNGIDFEHANVTYLIAEYLKRVHNDDFQAFYTWKRHYRYMDLLKSKPDSKGSLIPQYLTTPEREELWANRSEYVIQYTDWAKKKKLSDAHLRKLSNDEYEQIITNRLASSRRDFQKIEKLIRRYKVQDALMFIMVKDTLSKHLNFSAKDFKLRDIRPNATHGILSESLPMEFVYEMRGKVYTIKSKGLKLKNYGDFFALAQDKRLPSLLEILGTQTIDKEDIDLEFNNYDTSRPTIVDLVIDFEKYVYKKFPDIQQKALTERFDFRALLDSLLSQGSITKKEKEVMRLIRNSFSHNIYPDAGILQIRTLPDVAKSLIEVFGICASRIKP